MHKSILIICRTLKKLDTIIVVNIGVAILINGPNAVDILLSHSKNLDDLYIINIYLVHAGILMVVGFSVILFVISQKICDEVSNLLEQPNKSNNYVRLS